MASNIIVDQFSNSQGTKIVTVNSIYDKVNETNANLTSLTSPTAKVVTVDQIYTKVNESTALFKTRNVAFTAVKGDSYLITADVVATLPLGSTLVKGDFVRFAKTKANTPTIVASGTDTIVINSKTDTSVAYDDNVEIIAIWNGTTWEI